MSKERRKIRRNAKAETLAERLKKASKEILYISETDAEILPFVGEKAEAVNAETVLKQTRTDAPVEERDFEEFFKRLTSLQEWFGDEEIENANRFAKLKEILQKNLKDIKVFKIGTVEINIYIVGLDQQNILTGVQTKAVET